MYLFTSIEIMFKEYLKTQREAHELRLNKKNLIKNLFCFLGHFHSIANTTEIQNISYTFSAPNQLNSRSGVNKDTNCSYLKWMNISLDLSDLSYPIPRSCTQS